MKDLTNRQIDAITATVAAQNNLDARSWCRAAIAADRALNAPERLARTNSEFIRVRAQLEQEWSQLNALRKAERNRTPADWGVMRQALNALEAAKQGLEWYQDMHPEYRSGADDEMHAQIDAACAALAAAPTPPAEQPSKLETTYARQHAAHEIELTALIEERDHREEIINELCDAVLGPDRAEWSSAYYFEDAVSEVQERVAELETRKECRKSNMPAEQQEPAHDVLATLRAKVQELQGHQWSPSSPGLVVRSEVLALIDKMVGKV